MKKKKKKGTITKGEKLLYIYGVFAFIIMLSVKIFCGAKVGELKMNIEEIKYNIEAQEKTNESLTMKVNELTSFENVKKVVDEMGLAYNNENIIVVDKWGEIKWEKKLKHKQNGKAQENFFSFF